MLVNRLLWLHMRLLRWTHWHPFRKALQHPRDTQKRLLLEILARNRDTRFGREHGFDQVTSYDDFAQAVPIQDYESLRPFIEEQESKGVTALNAERPVMYAQTSGTTGKPKLIPILNDTLTRYKRSQAIHSYIQFSAEPRSYDGKLLFISSPAVEGRLDSGTPYGSVSGHVIKTLPALIRGKFLLPDEVFAIEDYDLKYLAILRLALSHRDVTSIGSANASTFLKLYSVLQDHRSALLEDIEEGTFRYADRLTLEVRTAIAPRLACPSDRVEELRRVLGKPELSFGDLWPDLRLLTTWTGGSCGVALGAVKKLLLSTTKIAELGYLSTEFRGTITVDLEHNLGAPTIHENFFEFVERNDWDAGRQEFHLVDTIERAKEYYVVITTGAGLYRYFMNDIVVVTGAFETTPTMQFLRKGKGVTNITGEKLYENQVVQAVHSTEAELGTAFAFFLMLADTRESVYRLIVEWPVPATISPSRMQKSVERILGELNVEYAQKRASGRLFDLELIPVKPGTGDAYKRDCLQRGQREGQFKILILQYLEDCSFPFRDYRLSEQV